MVGGVTPSDPRDRSGGEVFGSISTFCIKSYAPHISLQDPRVMQGRVAHVSLRNLALKYPEIMNKEEHLQRHLELCRHMYLRMLADGTWPWREGEDSPNPEDVIESEGTDDDV